MPRTTKPLTDTEVKNAKPADKPRDLYDGGGLILHIKPSGAKHWRFRYLTPSGGRNTLALGIYPAMTLIDARSVRVKYLALLAEGKDPQTERAAEKLAECYMAANTFELVALEWHAKEVDSGSWCSDHAGRILQRLRDDIFPHIGSLPIERLETRDLLVVLKAAVDRGIRDTPQRLRRYMAKIMSHAVQTGRIKYNPANDLLGAIATKSVTSRPTLPLTQTQELLSRIHGYQGRIAREASLFALLTGARSSEFRFARWDEFDLEQATWTIPPEREAVEGVKHSGRGEKMGRERIIYLSRQAVALLQRIQQINGNHGFVFTGQKAGTPISENTVNQLLRNVGYDTKADVCLHGFRTTMVSALNESGQFNKDAIERHIGHEGKARAGQSIRLIYMRSAQYLKERQAMLQWWADWLDAVQDTGHYIEPCEFNQNKATVIELHKTA